MVYTTMAVIFCPNFFPYIKLTALKMTSYGTGRQSRVSKDVAPQGLLATREGK